MIFAAPTSQHYRGKKNIMKLFDFHCDTASLILDKKCDLATNDHHISLDKAAKYDSYAQVTACYQSKRFSDAVGWERFYAMSDALFAEVEKHADRVTMVRHGSEILPAWESGKAAFILSIEDARILEGDLSRIDVLAERGVRIVTILWAGDTCIGGAHNTENGLTDFGKAVVRRLFELNIIPDISHASAQSADDVAKIAEEFGKPFIASHSCAYGVRAHSRNLRDRHIGQIIKLGGIIGMSICPPHLAAENATVETVCDHIEYYLAHGAGDVLCMGCDLDGTDLPEGFSDIRDIETIADCLRRRGHAEETIEKIFWKNALDFARRSI